MAKASANLFPYLHLVPAAAPASPAAGSQRLYLDSADGNKLKRKDSAGTVVTIEGSGSSGGGSGFTQVRKSASQTVPANTWTAITWNVEDVDSLAAHDNVTNNSRITVPTAGVYAVNFSLTTSSAPSGTFLQLGVNGVRVPGRAYFPSGSNLGWTLSRTLSLAASDYIEAWVYSGSSVVTTTFTDDECVFSAFRMGTV